LAYFWVTARPNDQHPGARDERARAQQGDRDAGRLGDDAERDPEDDLADVFRLTAPSPAPRWWCAG